MRRLLAVLLLCGSAWAGIATVAAQPAGKTQTTAGTSCAANTAAGFGTSTTHSVFIVVATAGAVTSPTVADNATGGTNTYTVYGPVDNTNGGHVFIAYSLNIPRVNAGGLVITASWTGSSRNSCVVHAYTGVVAAGVTNSATSGSANNTPTASTTSTSANSWMIAGMADAPSTATWSAATGNLRTSVAGGGSTTPGAAIVDNTAAGQAASITTSATLSVSTKNWAVAVIELRSDLILPVVTPNGTTANDTVSTTLGGSDAGVAYCYTTDGSSPASASPPTCSAGSTYAGAFNMPASGTGTTAIKVLAAKSGWTNSGITTSNNFVFSVGAVSDSPGAGTYNPGQTATLSTPATSSSTILYSTDGSAVACPATGNTYTVPLTINTTTTVKAIGCKTNYADSAAISHVYTIQQQCEVPGVSPSTSLSYTNDQAFTVSSGGSTCNSPTYKYCFDTANTCTPTTTYSGAVTLPGGTGTGTLYFRAIATQASFTDSGVRSVGPITFTTTTPVATPAGETFIGSVSVSLAAGGTTGGSIYYSTSVTPDCTPTGTLYSTSLSFSATTNLKAVTCKANYATGTNEADTYTLSVTHTYKVGPSGANCPTATSGACDYTTPALCSAAAVAGDTCDVYSGTYAGWTQSTSGSSGGLITFQEHSGETANISSRITISGRGYIKIDGFSSLTDSTTTCIMGDSTTNHVQIVNNTFTDCGISMSSAAATASDNIFGHNTWSNTNGTAIKAHSIVWRGSRNLIEYNTITYGAGDCFEPGGQYVVVRNNSCVGKYGNQATYTTSGTIEHIDFVQQAGGSTPVLDHFLGENNVFRDCTNDWFNCHTLITNNGAGLISDTLIWRYNYTGGPMDGSGAIGFGSGTGTFPNARAYNNTLATNVAVSDPAHAASNAMCIGFNASSVDGLTRNNICWNTTAGSASWSPIASSGVGITPGVGDINFTTGYSGNWANPYASESTYASLKNQNPSFASYPTDVHLSSSSSPAYRTGAALTTVSSGCSGSTTQIVVADGHYFQDGWGPDDNPIQPDWIRVGASATVQLNNHTAASPGLVYTTVTNPPTQDVAVTMNLANAISCSNGDSVYLYKTTDGTVVLPGALPNIGAFDTGTPVTSRTPATLAFGSQVIGTTSAAQSVTLSNSGNATASIAYASIDNTTDFGLTDNCGSTLSVATGSCTYAITFHPVTTGAKSGTLTISVDGGGPYTVSLSGTGANGNPAAALIVSAPAAGVGENYTVQTSCTWSDSGTLDGSAITVPTDTITKTMSTGTIGGNVQHILVCTSATNGSAQDSKNVRRDQRVSGVSF